MSLHLENIKLSMLQASKYRKTGR